MSRLSANTKKQRINRINRHTDQRGIILVVTLMIVLILALLGSAFLTTSGTEHQIAKNDQEIVQALYVAEAGLQTALNWKNQKPEQDLTPLTCPTTITIIGNGGFIAGDSCATVTNASPTRQQRIEATGYVPNKDSPRAVKKIAVLVCDAALFAAVGLCSSPFQDALFGLNGVTVSASTTDSYDCANGAYGGTDTCNLGLGHCNFQPGITCTKDAQCQNGDVGSNKTITLSGSTLVHGDASTVPGYALPDQSHVTGMVSNTEAVTTMPDVPCPAGGYTPSVPPGIGDVTYDPAIGDLKIKGGGSLTLTLPGTYYFHNLEISPGTLTIATEGHVDIFIGRQLKFQGGSFVNQSGLPSNLTIWGCGTDTSAWTFSSGGTDAYLGLYAPNHSLTLSGGGNYYGSFIAEGTITESGGTDVHYDECLGRGARGKFVPALGSWTELVL